AKSTTKQAAKKAAARPRADKADGESVVLAKIAAMPGPDRAKSERLHAIIKASAPVLSPRLWDGMPAYARDGKVVCFFRDTQEFKERCMTLGFNQEANLDDGAMWPIAFALKELTADEEARIGALVRKAVSWGLSDPMATERASTSSIPALTSPSPGANKHSGERRSAGRKCLSGLPAWSRAWLVAGTD